MPDHRWASDRSLPQLAIAASAGGISLERLRDRERDEGRKIAAAIANGGTGAPVGVGQMSAQVLASDFGLTANPANQPGGTNNAISGALSARVGSAPGSGESQHQSSVERIAAAPGLSPDQSKRPYKCTASATSQELYALNFCQISFTAILLNNHCRFRATV